MYRKAVYGAIIGASTAGGWLVVDLLLPEPIGDYLLFGLMGITNMAIGWQVGRSLGKQDKAKSKTLKAPVAGTE
ncbi:hypothetical protein [Ornithinibacillus contaminans]|uniref:hypothetical protein n=1 Tax=Ornithinibacillus contaminans TaxID=694055 RepID=UPI00064E06BB|nr:hypothetical protein [Ornithinibacillus contaminans]